MISPLLPLPSIPTTREALANWVLSFTADDLARDELRRRRNSRLRWFPDAGPLRRSLYPRHVEFFEAGTRYRERLFLAGNRVGKSEAGVYELVCHALGEYPTWWRGRRFSPDGPLYIWCAGDTHDTVRDILQLKLLGPIGDHGTGMIPFESLIRTTPRSGVADGVDTIYVRRRSGAIATITLKSYDQKRKAFQGTAQHVILLDEEPPDDIYDECLLRTMTTNGVIMITMTPLMGRTPFVLKFMPQDDPDALPGTIAAEPVAPSRYVVMCSWDEVPHLDAQAKADLMAALPPHQRDARMKGVPQLGAGAIYPVPEEQILVDPFEIPRHWPRGYGMDVGWKVTAGAWRAYDREAGIHYLYSEHWRQEAEPVVHVESFKARGLWIPGRIDPASRGRGQADGRRLIQDYIDLGLNLQEAPNAVEAGIHEIWTLLSGGRLKVFRSMSNWRREYRLYQRDEKGKVVKRDDHLMDATRYNVLAGVDWLETAPVVGVDEPRYVGNDGVGLGWMG